MDECEHLMIKAHDINPTDCEVKVILGVLYNVSRSMDEAITMFKQAAQLNPTDYLIWNKIGATLVSF